MGIYLGQLPPAEIARLKAELAETLITNFCYPRFFDPRTQSLRMRPVDRAKRQEVWLFLSSFDFTSWGRVDLTSPDLQNHIERLFIQFVQRNRSFFGEQGRRRMSDIRMLITLSGSSVVQALRNHMSGQRQGNPAFGSPRPVISWSASTADKYKEPTWEQISAATMLLQQQIQELRGEIKTSAPNEGRTANAATRRPGAPIRPPVLPGVANNADVGMPSSSQAPAPTPISQGIRGTVPLQGRPAASMNPAASVAPTSRPTATGPSVVPPTAKSGPLGSSAPYASSMPAKSGSLVPPLSSVESAMTSELPLSSLKSATGNRVSATAPSSESGSVAVVHMRNVPPATPVQPAPSIAAGQRDNTAMVVGEDDMAIFDQMRHQLLVWLRVEAIKAGLEINGQGPSQLLEILRQQGRLDETRLQVVSTLLNLSNQIIKTGTISLIDYKQALMFHLMHTRN
jgi:hypothetical protein